MNDSALDHRAEPRTQVPAAGDRAGSSAGVLTGPGPAVVFEGVTAGYGRRVALTDVSLDVQQGSLLAVIGPNGAGKSTLLKLIAGLLKPTAGKVTVLGGPPGSAARQVA